MPKKATATQLRVRRAKQVGEALAIFRERLQLSYDDLHLAMWNAGYEVSLRTLKRIILATTTPHATTLAAVQAFLKNAGAADLIKGARKRTVKVVRVKPRRGLKRWDSGS